MLEQETKNLLEKNLEVAQESLVILKKINRARMISNLFSFLKWMLIIGASIGIYYYIQPYLNQLMDLLKQMQSFQNIIPKNIITPR